MGLRDSSVVAAAAAADLTLGLVPSSEYHHRQFHHHHHHHHAVRELVPDLKSLQLYHRALQEERHKIRAFERELPFCMQLLDHAIEASREQLADRLTCKLDLITPSPDNFLLDCSAASAGGLRTRSTTLPALMQGEADNQHLFKKLKREYSPTCITAPAADQHLLIGHYAHAHQEEPADEDPHYRQQHHPHHDWLSANHHTAKHLPSHHIKDSVPLVALHEMATKGKVAAKDCYPTRLVANGVVDVAGNTPMEDIATRIFMPKEQSIGAQGVQRKPRRCWSTELHQLFLNALHQLGGCQAATPKQIRELMNVEGLTNDEVKSHLQKFRLHMRRPSLASQGDSTQDGHHLLVFGHVWMPESSTSPPSNYTNTSNTLSSFAQAMNYHSTMRGQERIGNIMEVPIEHPLLLPSKPRMQQEKPALDDKRELFNIAQIHMDEELDDEQREKYDETTENTQQKKALREFQNDDCHTHNDDGEGRLQGPHAESYLAIGYMHTTKDATKC